MIIYRPHCGSFEDAMKEAKEFEDEDHMKDYLVDRWVNGELLKEDIVIDDKVTNDDRNGWVDTRYVCTKRMGDIDYIEKYGCPQCIGMCATNYRRWDK